MTQMIRIQHLFQQREWADRQGRRIRQLRQWVDQTVPSWRGPALLHSSLPFRRPSVSRHWWILCRYGHCFNAAWNCLVFQTTPSVRLSSHLYLFLNMTQTTRDQPRRLDLQQEPSLQRGSPIRLRVLLVLSSDGPRRPIDRPGLPWDRPEHPWEDLGTTASPGIQDHAPHSPDPRQWSPQQEMGLHSTSMQRWTWIPREHFRRKRMLRATARRSLQRNMKSSGKLSLHPREHTRSTLPRLSERPGPLCWMSTRNFSERSWPSSKRLKFLRVLQRRPTCCCYVVMPSSGTSISSPQFSLQCVQLRLKVTMWLVLNQRSFKRVSGPSDKLIVWQAHQWLSPSKKSRPARRRHPRRRPSVFDRLGSPPSTTQRTVKQESPFRAGAGRARPRPFQGSKKSGKSSSSSAAKKRWRVPGGGSPGRFCPALAESAGQLPGHRHRRGRDGHCIPAMTSAHPSKHQFPDQKQPTRPSATRCLADEGSHRACHQSGFLQSFVSGTQEDGRSATCDRPVHSQPPHGSSTLQDGDARVRPISHQKSGVDGVDRYTRCLSSCADASSCPQVSAFRGQQEGVPVHLSSVWTGNFSTGVHQAAETHRLAVEAARCEATRLLRRLADQGRYTGRSSTARPDNHQGPPVSW